MEIIVTLLVAALVTAFAVYVHNRQSRRKYDDYRFECYMEDIAGKDIMSYDEWCEAQAAYKKWNKHNEKG